MQENTEMSIEQKQLTYIAIKMLMSCANQYSYCAIIYKGLCDYKSLIGVLCL